MELIYWTKNWNIKTIKIKNLWFGVEQAYATLLNNKVIKIDIEKIQEIKE